MEELFFVNNGQALERSDPKMDPTGKVIPQYTIVQIVNTKTAKIKGKTTTVVNPLPWTANGLPGSAWNWFVNSNFTQLGINQSYLPSDQRQGNATKSPREFTFQVLRKAGENPETWFSKFQYISFLGRVTNTPIHESLANHLKSVEKHLCEIYGGPYKDPLMAAEKMGFTPDPEDIKGSRRAPTSATRSFHLFGCAIDVEYSKNPYISESENDKEAIMQIFPRVDALVNGKTKEEFLKNGFKDYREAEKWNSALKTYFSFLESSRKSDLQIRLQVMKSLGVEDWKRKSLDEAKHRIREDLKWLSGVWSRKELSVEKNGFTNFREEFIDEIGLHWGVPYGDMMHFDMRDSPVGKQIAKWGKEITP